MLPIGRLVRSVDINHGQEYTEPFDIYLST